MYGVYTIVLTKDGWKKRFNVAAPLGWQPVYNARPTQLLPIITQEQPKALTLAAWKFLPHWIKEPKGRGVINARAESIFEKPYFRTSILRQRCLVPADGYFEWEKSGDKKVPYRFIRADRQPFSFAGLYDVIPGLDRTLGFAIITTEPNTVVAPVHDRMPAMLEPEEEQTWLHGAASLSDIQHLLDPFPSTLLDKYQVSTLVNKYSNTGSDVIAPL